MESKHWQKGALTMYFNITAYDDTKEGSLDRRMSVRPQHLENLLKVKEYGHVVCAGGITDDDGKTIGSYLIMDFAGREELERYLDSEPYIASGVWKDIKVEPCKVVIQNDEFVGA